MKIEETSVLFAFGHIDSKTARFVTIYTSPCLLKNDTERRIIQKKNIWMTPSSFLSLRHNKQSEEGSLETTFISS